MTEPIHKSKSVSLLTDIGDFIDGFISIKDTKHTRADKGNYKESI